MKTKIDLRIKENCKMEKINVKILQTQKGITLLVLVITIIVLLILAGITIGTITGDESTIVNASKAKFKTEIKDIEEKIELEEINNNDGEDFQFGTLKDLIGREDGYNEILYMEDGKLVYIEDKVSDKQAKWLEEMDIQAKQNIIPIYTGEQFKKIGTGEEIEIEEAGGEKFQFNIDSHYVLQNDINLNCSSENQWEPLASQASNPFIGILDGRNYKVSGIYKVGGSNIALFIYNRGTIKNLTLSDGYLEGTGYVAGFVVNNYKEVINCKNEVEITCSGEMAGGIVANNDGGYQEDAVIESCENNAYLSISNDGGGICGRNYRGGIVRKCINRHEIYLKDYNLGGIVGSNITVDPKMSVVEQCYNIGNILAYDGYSRYGRGGIVGRNSGIVRYCFNRGTINSNINSWSIGGIVGTNYYNNSTGTVEFSYNVGMVVKGTGNENGSAVGGNKAGRNYKKLLCN